jgi:hypothetical protein
MNSRFEIYNFENYFSNDDFKWVLNFIIKKIIFHDPEIADGIIYIKFEDEHVKDSYITTLPINMQLIYSIFYDSSLLFINKNEDFIKLLELRDKLYYFITNNKGIYTGVLKDSVSRLEIEDQEDMALVEKASNIIFDHVFKKALKNITLHTYSEALKMDIPLNIEYKKLGSLFQI